jgi:hypothetical protein
VRAGLVAVGAAIAIVGAGIVLAVGLPVSQGTHESHASASATRTLSPGGWYRFAMNATPAEQATETFSWNASSPTEVLWYVASCSTNLTWCVEGSPLKQWNGTSGEWSNNGAASAVYCVWIDVPAGQPVNFTGNFEESAVEPPTHLPTLVLAWLVVGGCLLAGIGGIGVYLGLFLPTDVYGRRGGAEEEFVDDPDDDGGIIDDMHGPPGGRA